MAFDKAAEAASVEDIRKSIEIVDAELAGLPDDEAAGSARESLEGKKAKLIAELKEAEESRKAAELAEHTSK